MKRTIYTKYHEKMSKMIAEISYDEYAFFAESDFEEYGCYFKKTVAKEETFPLYRYSSVIREEKFSLDLENLYFTSTGMQNDIFEGIPKSYFDIHSVEKYVQAISKLSYLKCFTETYTNNLMWAHYADFFKGVCIEYDICQLKGFDIQSQLYPVYYTKERLFTIDEDSLCDYIEGDREVDAISDTKGVFLQKADYWKYEREWRICYINYALDSARTKVVPFPCVSAIYLGPRISEENRRKTIEVAIKYQNVHNCVIRIYQMMLDEKTFELHPKEISDLAE